ncbi:calponin homology (CH) domain-containing protein [Ditylenchus destructor]|uniref:Calponin homology (CH) domain-containing protein n=1 Tax=Ditylenchus destructor TaxID=166010 RepID=A0AAD4NB85_9BILA|nr:calponin homology (CH) domain-containing protein [Ditylenchus destructor]
MNISRTKKPLTRTTEAEVEVDREVIALTQWINDIVSPAGLDVESPMEVERLLERTKEANAKLKEILTSSAKFAGKQLSIVPRNTFNSTENNPASSTLSYIRKDSLNDLWRQRAIEIFDGSDVPQKIDEIVNSDKISVRKGVIISSNIGIQMGLLRLLLCFHPVWLKLALETVFQVSIVFPDTPGIANMRFVPTISNFIMHNLLKNMSILKKGYKKQFVLPPEAIQEMHRFFLSKLCQLLFLIEKLVERCVVPNLPCMFLKNSSYKSISDIFAFLSQEVIAGDANIQKALARVKFTPTYKQTIFEEFDYKVKNFYNDLSDGIILGRLLEILSAKDGKMERIVSRLRDPAGDRVRKITNIRTVINEGCRIFPEKLQQEYINDKDIVDGKRGAIVKLLWRLVDIRESSAIIIIQRFVRSMISRYRIQQRLQLKRLSITKALDQLKIENAVSTIQTESLPDSIAMVEQ